MNAWTNAILLVPVWPMLRPKIGTRYVREVTVLEAGHEYNNKTYRSLSEIARFITGTKWSGPAFFGQRRSKKEAIGSGAV